MYRATEWTISEDAAARLVTLSRAIDLRPGPGGSRITPVPLEMFTGPHFLVFPHDAERLMFVSLEPSAQLVAHRDPPIAGTRYHVPLVVNPGCWSFAGGHWQQLEVGRAYALDPTEEHGAVNWGSERRLHFIFDTRA